LWANLTTFSLQAGLRLGQVVAARRAGDGAPAGAARRRGRGHARRRGEKGAVPAQQLDQLQPFLAVLPPECMGQLAPCFWADLTPLSAGSEGWLAKLDGPVRQLLLAHGRYDGRDLTELLRAIRNVAEHWSAPHARANHATFCIQNAKRAL
jgi:hypothetical protein